MLYKHLAKLFTHYRSCTVKLQVSLENQRLKKKLFDLLKAKFLFWKHKELLNYFKN